MSEERYYLVKIDHSNASFENMTQTEHKLTKDWKWCSLEEIQNSTESVFIDNLGEELTKL